jgi:Ni,Fe-hydrogenase maturation factor
LPDRIVIYAIEAANIREFGEGLSPQVAAGAGPAVQAVLAEVRSLAPQKG